MPPSRSGSSRRRHGPSSASTTPTAGPSPTRCSSQGAEAVPRISAAADRLRRHLSRTRRDRARAGGSVTGSPISPASARCAARTTAQNAAAAVAACCALGLGAADDRRAASAPFPALPHRMEEVGRRGAHALRQRRKATNADSTEKALPSFPRSIYWILGGKPKEGGIEALSRISRASPRPI